MHSVIGVLSIMIIAGLAGDACVSERSLISNSADAIRECGKSCRFSFSMKPCMSKCVEELGLSAPCANCFAGQGSCVKSKCMVSCLKGADSAACVDCRENCAVPFTQCSGIKLPISQSVSSNLASSKPACTGESDAAIALKQGSKGPAYVECGSQCMFKMNFKDCFSKCVQSSKVGFSKDCAACYTEEAGCSKENCKSACIFDTGAPKCHECSVKYCGRKLVECSGLNLDGTPMKPNLFANVIEANVGDSCNNQADIDQLTEQGTGGKAFIACGKPPYGCGTKSGSQINSCFTKCVETQEMHLTHECAVCYGINAGCSRDHCLSQCMFSPGSKSCKDCSIKHCGDALQKCSGVNLDGTPKGVLV